MLAVTIDPDRAVGLTVGNPFSDKNALEFGLWAFETHNLAFLVAPTVHPRVRFDGAAALTAAPNRINFINAVLSQMNDLDFPNMHMVELISAPADEPREALVMNPNIESADDAFQGWAQDLHHYGLPIVHGSEPTPTLVFESTLSLVRKRVDGEGEAHHAPAVCGNPCATFATKARIILKSLTKVIILKS
ncbi:MAG TPA: hypothetical protein VE954_19810 [Oligoflexus sp.]|uniref:hypothetical protein n=1 Tax=Oligoflexus sp. TaxID=1971216 RepID=UPI002D75D517|nr:hypothetical protein [Oligoflexus sp.]HYX35349.1 hypothetical protein [Oligoflexus sp.]